MTGKVRHTIATIQELLGHTSLQTTMIYTHVLHRDGLGIHNPADKIMTRFLGGWRRAAFP